MKKRICLAALVLLTVSSLFAGGKEEYYSPLLKVACKKDASIQDGFNAPYWNNIERIPLIRRAEEVRDLCKLPVEQGEFQLIFNGKDLLLKGTFADSDIFTEAKMPWHKIDRTGDTVQFYLKPDNTPCYWFIQAAPNDFQFTFLILGEGRRDLDKSRIPHKEISMQLRNRIDAKNKRWEFLMQIPLPLLAEKMKAQVGSTPKSWKFAIQRSNFSRHLTDQEISGYPQLVRHFYYTLCPSCAKLQFER